MRSSLRHFKASFAVTLAGLALGAALGWHEHHSAAGVGTTVFIVAVLAVLETSISFDNAVVNATVLRTMTPVWRHRFLTWGIAIAVFGMRLVFPLVVVSAVARVGPFEALRLAVVEPAEYARILASAHHLLGAFGGTFLGMVCLRFFFDAEKNVHWIALVERRLARLGRIRAIELGLMLLVVLAFSRLVPTVEDHAFLAAGVLGIITYIGVDGIGAVMEMRTEETQSVVRSGLASFLYLEVLDATFSFDGVIGAFALTSDLFVIAAGLGIGAMFVRSLTVLLVEQGAFDAFRYLEHGAFWAIGALALMMFVGTVVHVPEAVTGLIGAVLIGLSLWSSVRYRARAERLRAEARLEASAPVE
jgi:hypothetical protein